MKAGIKDLKFMFQAGDSDSARKLLKIPCWETA